MARSTRTVLNTLWTEIATTSQLTQSQKKGTINTSPCWDDWISLVENNKEMFESLKKDEIDSLFNFYDAGYTSGMVLGMKMAR